MIGEYRDCGMLTTTPPIGVVLSATVQAELPRLFCGRDWDYVGIQEFINAMPNYTDATKAVWHGGDWNEFDGNFHVLPVRYFGRIDRTDAMLVTWRCQRKSDSLGCKALN